MIRPTMFEASDSFSVWAAIAILCGVIFVWNVVIGISLRVKRAGRVREVLRIKIGDKFVTYDPDHPSQMVDERFAEPLAGTGGHGPSPS